MVPISPGRRYARPRLRARLLTAAGVLLVVCATAAGPWPGPGPGSAAYGLAAQAAPELHEDAVLVRRTTRDAMRELRQVLGVLGPLARDTGPDALTDATGTRADVEALSPLRAVADA